MVKVYLYLNKVDETAGPLQYCTGSFTDGAYGNLWKWRAAGGHHYPPDGELEKLIPESAWVNGVGTPGTVIFCNTNGLHRGGIATSGSRVVATWTYVTPASLWPRRYEIAANGAQKKLSPAASFAISS